MDGLLVGGYLAKSRLRHPRCLATAYRQRGAFGITGVLVLLLAIVFTVLAVDSGRLMLEQQRMQKIADMAAMDASSHAGSCGDGTLAGASAAAQASAIRNGYSGNLNNEANGVLLGDIDSTDGIRTFTSSDPESATAVQVTTRSTVPASLLAGGLFNQEVTLEAKAVAERQALAAFSAGSLLLSINSEDSALLNSLLNGMLGSNISLDAVSYKGIADTQITLLDLVNASASAGTVDELLSANTKVADLLQLYADAVDGSSSANAAVSALLLQLITANLPNANLTLGDILNVSDPTDEGAAEVKINLLDLITTTALVANGKHALTLPLDITLPAGLLSVQSLLTVIEPPQIAIGPPGKDADGNWRTQIETAQIRLNTDIKSTISLLGLLSAKVDLRLNLEVAQGSAWLQSIECHGPGNPESLVTIGAQPGIASVSITRSGGSGSTGQIIVSSALLGDIAKVDVGLDVAVQNPSPTPLVYRVDTMDPDSLPQVQRATSSLGGSLDNGLSNLADSLVLKASLLKIVSLGLDGIIATLVSNLLDPLLTQLGT
ncbi:MAG: TadG family pilus assembly protein, partial [Gammaproteobacteria bacterium]